MWGLHVDGEVEPDHPGVELPKTGIRVRMFPPRYLTARVRLYHSLWWQQKQGRSLRSDGVMLWPARLVATLAAIEAWPPLWSRTDDPAR